MRTFSPDCSSDQKPRPILKRLGRVPKTRGWVAGLQLSLFLLACTPLVLITLSLTGCCGSGTNSTTTTTSNGGGTSGGGTGGGPTPTTNRPVFVIATSKFVYVADAGASSIAQYRIGPSGALTPLSPAMVTTNISKPDAIAISDDEQFAYVANQGNNTVALFKIGTTGTLSPLSPATVKINGTPSRFTAVDFASKTGTSNDLYIGHTGGIAGFEINSNGSLTSLGADMAVGPVTDLAESNDGDGDYFLDILDAGSQSVFDTPLGISSVSTKYPTGTHPAALINAQDGFATFVLNQGGNTISSYFAANGELDGFDNQTSPSTVALSAPVSAVDIPGDGDELLLVVNSGSNTISELDYIDPANNATPVHLRTLSTVATGGDPAWIALSPTGQSLAYPGEYVYVANQSGSISQYVFNNGALTPLTPASVPG